MQLRGRCGNCAYYTHVHSAYVKITHKTKRTHKPGGRGGEGGKLFNYKFFSLTHFPSRKSDIATNESASLNRKFAPLALLCTSRYFSSNYINVEQIITQVSTRSNSARPMNRILLSERETISCLLVGFPFISAYQTLNFTRSR